ILRLAPEQLTTAWNGALTLASQLQPLDTGDTNIQAITNAAGRYRFAGVMKFIVPISSSLPQRPQLLRSFFHCSNCCGVTLRLPVRVLCGVPAVRVSTRTAATETIPTNMRFDILFLLPSGRGSQNH